MRQESLHSFKDLNSTVKRAVSSFASRDMVMDNIRDLIPDWVDMKASKYMDRSINLSPKEDNLTADKFDKFVTRLSKKLRSKPYVDITEQNMMASWCLYFGGHTNRAIRVEFSMKNTEACEVIIKRVLVDQTELTGYCKLLKEKQYYEQNS